MLLFFKAQLLLGFLLAFNHLFADVINPTLVEVTAYQDKQIKVELLLNIEAVLSNSAIYKNSKNSPNSDRYDYFRQLLPEQVKQHFLNDLPHFLSQAKLMIKNTSTTLAMKVVSLEVPDIGYQGRPRLSKLVLTTQADISKPMIWHYQAAYGEFVYRYRFYNPDEYTWSVWEWVKNTTSPIIFKIPITKSATQTTLDYINIGFLHILPKGLDHILFIIGIALLALSWQKLLTMVTIFTIAHSITLALATYSLVMLPSVVVEPLIALSIAYIGIENLGKPNHLYTRYGVIFMFGLLHGLGFASVLQSFQTDTNSLIYSLIGFNIGVELGQVLIISLVLFGLWFLRLLSIDTKTYATQPIAVLITITGLLWMFERIFI